MKKKIIVIIIICISLCTAIYFINNKIKSNQETSSIAQDIDKLPLPETTGGQRGKLGIDKNINELTIDQYLGRIDTVYRDMRMLEDPGEYEYIGGDSKLSGYIKGFEVISLPYIIPVKNLPVKVGTTYDGVTLFSVNSQGEYIPNYNESIKIIEELFPKDKNIFLMCGGGGYAGMMKEFLISAGWDANKIYNVGAYWYYEGMNKIKVKKNVDGKITYDFASVPYHNVDFTTLTKLENVDIESFGHINIQENQNKQNENVDNQYKNAKKVTLDDIYYTGKGDLAYSKLDLDGVRGFEIDTEQGKKDADEYLETTTQKKADIINKLIEDKASFVAVVYNTYASCINTDGNDFEIAVNGSEKLAEYNISSYSMNSMIFRKTKLYKTVRYDPTIIVIEKGEIVSYIDANKDLIENEEQLDKWIKSHITIKESNNKEQETSNNNSSTVKVIAIDPGHQAKGNSEKEPIGPGATETKAKVTTGATGVSTGQKESELNLKVSLLLEEELTKKGYTVIMTRTTNDVNISNSERANIAKSVNANAFIRIHANSSNSSSAKGVLTMCQTENNIYNGSLAKESYNLSKLIVDNIAKKTGAINRGVTKTDTMSGINWSTVPTTIVEMGFLSNPEEDKLMETEEYQKKIVDGIVQGIDEYFENK